MRLVRRWRWRRHEGRILPRLRRCHRRRCLALGRRERATIVCELEQRFGFLRLTGARTQRGDVLHAPRHVELLGDRERRLGHLDAQPDAADLRLVEHQAQRELLGGRRQQDVEIDSGLGQQLAGRCVRHAQHEPGGLVAARRGDERGPHIGKQGGPLCQVAPERDARVPRLERLGRRILRAAALGALQGDRPLVPLPLVLQRLLQQQSLDVHAQLGWQIAVTQ